MMDDTELSQQVEMLKSAAARSISPSLTAKYIAVSDPRVRNLLLDKIKEGNVLGEIVCRDSPSSSGHKTVCFDFDRQSNAACIVKPAFAVVVNFIDGYVAGIVDPYVAPVETVQFLPIAAPAATNAIGDLSSAISQSRFVTSGGTLPLASDGTLPLASDGTLPLASDGTLPLASDGTLPLRIVGYLVLPAGWRFGNG